MSAELDLAVVGGGPAGLAAATLAAELGLAVSVFDEQATLGGQIYRNVETVARDRSGDLTLLGEDYQQGLDLVEAFRRSSACFQANSLVWDISANSGFNVSRDGSAEAIQAKHILLASGAMERPVPIPGWTLPGVMTAGAAQTLLKTSAMVPQVPSVIAGSGPLLYLITRQLLQAGVPIKALLLTARNQAAAMSELPRALLAGNYLWKGLAWQREIQRAGVPILDIKNLRAEGEEQLETVSFEVKGQTKQLDVGLLLLHEGVVPNTQLSMLAGCAHDWQTLQHAWHPRLDDWGLSSVESISIAGDGGGINGAQAAAYLGRIAVLQIAHKQGYINLKTRNRMVYPERAWLKKHLRIRRFLDRMFEPSTAQRIPQDDATLVCRCEEISAGELRKVVQLGCMGPNQAKAFTRCGMGPCQGRLCSLTVSELIAAERGVPVGEVGHYRVRPPLKPLTVGELAGLAGLDSEPSSMGGLPT